MDKNALLSALYQISVTIGNTLDLQPMLDESIHMILSRLNCSSAALYQKSENIYNLFYAKPKVLTGNEVYIHLVKEMEKEFFEGQNDYIVKKVDNKYYYFFILKNFGYFVLTKSGDPFEELTVKSLKEINLKLVNAIRSCLIHTELQENKARLSEAQSIVHIGSWRTSFPSMKHHWDDEIFRILGYEPQSFEPNYRHLLQRLTSKSRKEMRHVISQVLKGELNADVYTYHAEIKRKDGSIAILEVRSRIIFDQKGKPVSLVGTTLDITKQRQLEVQLREESTLLKTIINTVPLRIFWRDKESRYLGVNKLFAQDANIKNVNEIIGKTDYDLPWKNEADKIRKDDIQMMQSGIAKIDYEEVQTHEDGSTIWVSISKVPFKNEKGKIIGIVGSYHDITIKKEFEENLKLHRNELEYQTNHDILTGLPNRLLFLDRLEQSLLKANRKKSQVAVLFIDMDRFKEINDSFGHVFGDEAIKEVANRIQRKIRISDTVARFGGDEFVMILDDITQSMDIVEIVKKLMDSMHNPIIIGERTVYVTVSIGISIYPNDAVTADNLLKNADAAMYKAKNSGRNTYKFYTEDMTEKALTRITLESNLRQAIKQNDFLLYFQPQVNAKTNKIVGMESLIRWQHTTMGFVPPLEFISIAEDTGLIVPLGKWILKECMLQITKWHKEGLEPGILAINLSMVQLREVNFVTTVKTLLKETTCKPEWLKIEITEGQVMEDPEQTILILHELNTLGIKIAIDDFGTGYSSLSYLKRLPINTLKIDRSFIQDIPQDEDDMAIAKAIIALAKSLNLNVIAEGVETEEQKLFLVENECIYIQGYLYAKPMPADKMAKALKECLNRKHNPNDVITFQI